MPAVRNEAVKRFIGFPEAEATYGVCESTLRRLAAQGKLRIFRPSPRRSLLSVAEVDQLFAASGR